MHWLALGSETADGFELRSDIAHQFLFRGTLSTKWFLLALGSIFIYHFPGLKPLFCHGMAHLPMKDKTNK